MKQQNVTSSRSITVETEKLLNQQIVMEGKSSAAYPSMASWCQLKDLIPQPLDECRESFREAS